MPGYTCDLCNAEQAVLLQTNLTSGETIAVGGDCLVPFAIGFVEQLVGPIQSAPDEPVPVELTEKAKTRGRGGRSASKTPEDEQSTDSATTTDASAEQ
jgi:hypothetical protein